MPGRLVLSLLSATFRFRGEVRFEPPTRLGEFSDSIDWEASQAGRIVPDRARTGILRCSRKVQGADSAYCRTEAMNKSNATHVYHA